MATLAHSLPTPKKNHGAKGEIPFSAFVCQHSQDHMTLWQLSSNSGHIGCLRHSERVQRLLVKLYMKH